MEKCYTSTQIIKFLYNELPALEHLETEYAIANNPEWRAAYVKLNGALSALPKIQFFPKHSTVKSILQYSSVTS